MVFKFATTFKAAINRGSMIFQGYFLQVSCFRLYIILMYNVLIVILHNSKVVQTGAGVHTVVLHWQHCHTLSITISPFIAVHVRFLFVIARGFVIFQ